MSDFRPLWGRGAVDQELTLINALPTSQPDNICNFALGFSLPFAQPACTREVPPGGGDVELFPQFTLNEISQKADTNGNVY